MPKKITLKHPPSEAAGLAALLERVATAGELQKLLGELLTPNEIHDLSLRLRLLQMLRDGVPQRKISETLHISLCKITRGSRILKNPDSVIVKLLQSS